VRDALLAFVCVCAVNAASGQAWHTFYETGFRLPTVGAWVSDLTSSERLADGLRVADPSGDKGSGRFYWFDWQADPGAGAAAEARVRVVSCSQAWGVVLLVSDGVHEEGVTLLPDKILLAHAGLTVPFAAGGAFHTYRVAIRGSDIRVEVDGRLVLDGRGKFAQPAHGGRNRIGFGAASSDATGEAVWQFVRFTGGKADGPQVTTPETPGLAVTVGDTRRILENAIYKSLFKYADGRLCVGGKRSEDAGRTWVDAPSFGVGAYQFPDGEIIGLGFKTRQAEQPGTFTIPLRRSTDRGATVVEETAVMRIPAATSLTGDDGSRFEGPVADHAIVGLRDGAVLAAMYGVFSTDRVPVPTMPDKWQCFKYRTFVVRSADRGRTWEYLATVAYDPAIGLESFCEADLLRLPSGDILCFMRTGGSGGRYTPLHLSRSRDDGRTWSAPQPIADRGVWPNACRMRNGVIVCTYGRPGNWLMFSPDDGQTWSGHFCFYNGPTTSYNCVEEVAPDTLFVVYDRQQVDDSGNLCKEFVGTYVTVRRQ